MTTGFRTVGTRTDSPDQTDPRAAALALLPELTARPVPSRRRRHQYVQSTLAALATVVMLGTIAVPLALARDTGVAEQIETPVTVLEDTDLSAYESFAAGADATSPAAPLVLSFHDIAPEAGNGGYVVTPSDFESQIQMLDRAGYESLNLEEFLAYREGTFTPPARSFLLTFDDGTSGLWRYADPILARYGMSAVSFLITGSVGTHQPYYLTWAEVERMATSGRWAFGSHTDALHHRGTIDADGTVGGALTHRLWTSGAASADSTPSAPVQESEEAYTTRIAADLERSVTAMTEHGLPAPTVFAYPFSELDDNTAEAREQSVATTLIAERFEVAFVNAGRHPRPVSQRDAGAPAIERLEIFTGEDDRDVFDQVVAMTSMPVLPLSLTTGGTSGSSLTQVEDWSSPTRQAVRLEATGGGIRPAAHATGFVAADWAAARTADWSDYSITARTAGLGGEGRTVGLTVRVGSDQPVRVRVSDRQAQVLDADGAVIGVIDLDPGAVHDVRISVAADATTVRVDGRPEVRVPVEPTGVRTGGFGLDWAPGPGPTRGNYATLTALEVRP